MSLCPLAVPVVIYLLTLYSFTALADERVTMDQYGRVNISRS